MMKMIKVREVYYDVAYHCYTDRILAINPSEIESISEFYDRDNDSKSRISLKTGYTAYCKDSVDKIMAQISEEG